jgi:DNA modification methylase
MGDVAMTDASLVQAIGNGLQRKLVRVVDQNLLTVLDTVEALLFGDGDKLGVLEQTGRRFVEKCIDAEYVHDADIFVG